MTVSISAHRRTRRIHTDALVAHLRSGAVLVDVRPMAAYNGWRLGRERRGGHIPGAVSLPATWLDRLDDDELELILRNKGVSPERTVILYGSRASDAAPLRGRLRALGYPHVLEYAPGWAAWADDAALPAEALPNHERLVHPAWLQGLMAGARPEHSPAGETLVFHVNFGVPDEYADGHIPGALYLDTNRLEDPATWNRRSPKELAGTLGELGITSESPVVLYGRDTVGDANERWPGRRAGQIAASRAALILTWAGVRDVRLLDGGYDAWVEAGLPIESTIRIPTPRPEFGRTIPARPEVIVDIDEAREILADREGAVLVSVRTWKEHIGKVSGYNYIGPAGRIAGDVWGNCGTDAYHMQHYRNVDNTMRAYPEIAASWTAAGITPDKRVAFYCGTGWRAAETWFYAHLMGWPSVAVYDGGWFEWSQDPLNNPIEVGEPGRSEAAA